MTASRLKAVVAALSITVTVTTAGMAYTFAQPATYSNTNTQEISKEIENRVCKDRTDPDITVLEKYTKKAFPGYTVIVTTIENFPENRVSEDTLYVEEVVSTSEGYHGYDTDGYYICYNKKHDKGEKVVSYIIYNPTNNIEDDVLGVIDSGMIRY